MRLTLISRWRLTEPCECLPEAADPPSPRSHASSGDSSDGDGGGSEDDCDSGAFEYAGGGDEVVELASDSDGDEDASDSDGGEVDDESISDADGSDGDTSAPRLHAHFWSCSVLSDQLATSSARHNP